MAEGEGSLSSALGCAGSCGCTDAAAAAVRFLSRLRERCQGLTAAASGGGSAAGAGAAAGGGGRSSSLVLVLL